MEGGEEGLDDDWVARGNVGIGAALERALEAADGQDVRVGGGDEGMPGTR